MKILQTAERVSHVDISDNYVYQRSLLAYRKAATLISGKVLEIGTGSGYGLEILAPETSEFVTIDKFDTNSTILDNVKFKKMTVPPLKGIESDSFDFVVTFQVIEHINKDSKFVEEIHRVLKKGGQMIVTTPNKKMSLTRNPWHVREYSINELEKLLLKYFQTVQTLGVFGNRKIMEYYENNKKAVERITRFDILKLQYLLPRQFLQIPYDILNRMNRRKLLKNDNELVRSITVDDYRVAEAKEGCFDLFYISTK